MDWISEYSLYNLWDKEQIQVVADGTILLCFPFQFILDNRYHGENLWWEIALPKKRLKIFFFFFFGFIHKNTSGLLTALGAAVESVDTR